jgi:hypothetical protein
MYVNIASPLLCWPVYTDGALSVYRRQYQNREFAMFIYLHIYHVLP